MTAGMAFLKARGANASLSEYGVLRANGFCEGCGKPAPVLGPAGSPNLEVHSFSATSVVALCPECHAKIHRGKGGREYEGCLARSTRDIEEAIDSGGLKVVTAAIIVNDAGRVLVTQRGYGHLKGKWEFPGGKVLDNGESLEDCIRREIWEELSLTIIRPRPYYKVDFDYGDFFLRMFTFLCRFRGAVLLHEHSAAKWVGPEEMPSDLAPADILVAKHIRLAGCR